MAGVTIRFRHRFSCCRGDEKREGFFILAVEGGLDAAQGKAAALNHAATGVCISEVDYGEGAPNDVLYLGHLILGGSVNEFAGQGSSKLEDIVAVEVPVLETVFQG